MSSGRAWCLLLVLALPVLVGAATPIPAELKEALKPFRSEGSRGWAFTQTTRGEGKSQIETFDPALREFHRWVLIERDGRAPTPEDTQRYNELQTRRSTAPNAPNVKDQIDETDCELLSDDGIRASWRFRLRATDKDDSSAEHMRATFTLHRPSATIERVELASFEPFRPVLGMSITDAKTVIDYSLPEGDRPTLLQQVTMRIRGRAWLIKSMDQDLMVTYSNYTPIKRK